MRRIAAVKIAPIAVSIPRTAINSMRAKPRLWWWFFWYIV